MTSSGLGTPVYPTRTQVKSLECEFFSGRLQKTGGVVSGPLALGLLCAFAVVGEAMVEFRGTLQATALLVATLAGGYAYLAHVTKVRDSRVSG